ncbi:MAG: AmmeMemoRadiSam system protein B [Proteobacteria bacterium]|nr:AmmeMemoRadiSam system protein B [Pseudomonadota bacterium]
MKSLRRTSVAGSFYPDSPNVLKKDVQRFLSQSRAESKHPVKFLIVPHAGYMYSGKTAGDAFAEIFPNRYQRVFILGPSHRFYFQGIAESIEDHWESPLGTIRIEPLNHSQVIRNSQYHKHEHCLEVQIPFLTYLLPQAQYSPLLLSGPTTQAETLAGILMRFDTRETLWVISSDFNHTGPNFQHNPRDFGFDTGEAMDFEAIEHIASGNIEKFSGFLDRTQATICGALPILVAMHMTKKMKRRDFEFKTYDCSGKKTGDINSVGYAALYS